MSRSIHRMTNHLIKKDHNAVKEAMKQRGMDLVEIKDPITEAASRGRPAV